MLATLKKQRNCIKKCYISKDMNPEEREEYHKTNEESKGTSRKGGK